MEQIVLNSILNNHKEAIEKNHEAIHNIAVEVITIEQIFINELGEIYKKLFGDEIANIKKELIEKAINESKEHILDKISKMEGINNEEVNKRRSIRKNK